MIFLCSTDTCLVETFAGLPFDEDEVKHISDMSGLDAVQQDSVNLLLIDLKCCEETDIPALKQPAVALAEVPRFDQGMRLLRRGVRGYGNRHMHRDNLMELVSAVKGGQVWLPPDFITRMISSLSSEESGVVMPETMEPLSRREEEVAGFVTEGLANREIADKMQISVRTVKAHLTSIFAKTGFRDRLELAVRMKRR